MHCKPTNGVAAIFTTLQCPLACPDCSVRANRNNQRVAFDGKAAIHFLDQLKLRGWHHLTITGGEPTLIGYRLAWLVDRAHERGFRVMVQSNGYNVKELAAYGCADVISLTHYGAINRHDLPTAGGTARGQIGEAHHASGYGRVSPQSQSACTDVLCPSRSSGRDGSWPAILIWS